MGRESAVLSRRERHATGAAAKKKDVGDLVVKANDPRQIKEWLAGVGDRWWAPVVLVALDAIFNTTLLPATVLTLTAGVVWGRLVGDAHLRENARLGDQGEIPSPA